MKHFSFGMNKELIIAEIKQRTGIDFSRYATQNLLHKIEAAFGSIPNAQLTILSPIGLILLVDALWFFTRSSYNVATVLLFVWLLVVAVLVGGGVGLYRAAQHILTDTQEAVLITIETTQLIYKDLQQVSTQIADKDLQIPTPSDVLRGVALGIIFPTLTNLAIRKAGIIAKVLVWVIEKTFLQMILRIVKLAEDVTLKQVEKLPTEKIDAQVTHLNTTLATGSQKIQTKLQQIARVMKVLESIQQQITTLLQITRKVVCTPILTVTVVIGGVSVIIVFILYLFL